MTDCPENLILSLPPLSEVLAPELIFGETPARLEVDIGCGKGRFLVARAQSHPDTCFLGIDKRMIRVRKAAGKVLRAGLSNVRLLCADARMVVGNLLGSESVDCYYLFFPDPWPKRRHHRRRLFDRAFADALAATMAKNGELHIITDHHEYFKIMQDILSEDSRFSSMPRLELSEGERTEFQMVFMELDASLYFCSFRKI